jgi:hypothetical protein
MASADELLDGILDKLVQNVEMAVHALYRGDVRQGTARARTEVHRKTAREALAPLVGATPRASAAVSSATAGPAAGTVAPEDAAAITRCVMAWLSMGAPSTTAPDSRCVPAGRELIPTWGEREKARAALRRLSPG